MKCPFCNLEMMEGYLKAGRYVQFQEMENGRKGNQYLVAKSFMGDAKMEGYLCPSCRKLILDIPLVDEPPRR
ncbi:PF20097 family protein [Anaerotignum lactatifermentans]|uniref:PF20097 family protein n=1 Tax=Anaerotignum lactatifermentans TaxID=160404 RepID=UPI003AB8DA10